MCRYPKLSLEEKRLRAYKLACTKALTRWNRTRSVINYHLASRSPADKLAYGRWI